jgi:hypothetical protein
MLKMTPPLLKMTKPHPNHLLLYIPPHLVFRFPNGLLTSLPLLQGAHIATHPTTLQQKPGFDSVGQNPTLLPPSIPSFSCLNSFPQSFPPNGPSFKYSVTRHSALLPIMSSTAHILAQDRLRIRLRFTTRLRIHHVTHCTGCMCNLSNLYLRGWLHFSGRVLPVTPNLLSPPPSTTPPMAVAPTSGVVAATASTSKLPGHCCSHANPSIPLYPLNS